MAKAEQKVKRRALLCGTAAATVTALAMPNIARAASNTVTIWWNAGFYAAEDAAFRRLVADWEKQSGAKARVSLFTNQQLVEKVVSALATGQTPDLIYSVLAPNQIIPQAAWDDKLSDVSDVVATQQHEYSETALRAAQLYNNTTKKRSFYCVPFEAESLNIPVWRTLVEEAGFKLSDIPNKWDEFFHFFEPVQRKLRAKGLRHVYGLGYPLSTTRADTYALSGQFLMAYGGDGIITPDGKPHLDDPTVRRAIILSLEALTRPYNEGYVPPDAINWADPDNNDAFHSREVVMTPNSTISIAAAVSDDKQEYFHDIATLPLPLANDGKPVPVLLIVISAFIPKKAANIGGAKQFMRYLIQPEHLNNYLKQARGRWLPVMGNIVKNDPYWLDPKDPHRSVAIKQGVLSPTVVWPYVYNPGFSEVNARELFGVAEAAVVHGAKPEDAADKLLKQMGTILAKYPIP